MPGQTTGRSEADQRTDQILLNQQEAMAMLGRFDMVSQASFFDGDEVFDEFDERYYQDINKWHPSEAYLNSALYAGEETMEGLEQEFSRKLTTLGAFAKLDTEAKQYVEGSIDTDKIMTIKSAIDVYLGNSTRRTGEPASAHPLRVALRVMETFCMLRDRYEAGYPVPRVHVYHVEAAIIAALLHDHMEDEYKATIDGQSTKLRGGVHFEDSVPEGQDDGLYVYRYKVGPEGEVMSIEEVPEFKIECGSYLYAGLKELLKGLNTNDKGNVSMRQRIESAIREIEEKHRNDIYMIILPLVIKFCDRLDNLATYFKAKKDNIEIADSEHVFDKMHETLREFGPLEDLMMRAIRIMMKKSSRAVTADTEGQETDEPANMLSPEMARIFYPLLSIFPTLPAKLMLLGQTWEEIYSLDEGLPKAV